MTFNDYVEEHPDVAGNLQLKTEFNKAEIKGTTTQEILSRLKIRMFLLQLTLSLMYKQLRIKRVYLIDQLIQMKLIESRDEQNERHP